MNQREGQGQMQVQVLDSKEKWTEKKIAKKKKKKKIKEMKKDGCDQIKPLRSIWTFCNSSRNRVFPGGKRPFDFG
jgi:hypothetical protein